MRFTGNGRALLGVSITFTILAVLTILLRLSSRKIVRMRWGWDDSWIVAAGVSLCTLCAVTIWSATVGGAKDLNQQPEDIQMHSFEIFLKATFIGSPFYLFTMTATRFSLTCFLRHLSPIDGLRYTTISVDTFNAIYFLSTLFGNVFSCHPVNFLWHPVEGGGCFLKFNLFVVITESFGVLLDFIVLAIPIWMVATLRTPTRTKILVLGVFGLGGFVIITGIVRVILAYNSKGKYVNFLNSAVWTACHAGTAVICANLPTFKPLYPKLTSFTSSIRRMYDNLRSGGSGTQRATGTPYPSSKNAESDSARIRAPGSQGESQEGLSAPASIKATGERDPYELHDLEPGRIHVKNTVDVV